MPQVNVSSTSNALELRGNGLGRCLPGRFLGDRPVVRMDGMDTRSDNSAGQRLAALSTDSPQRTLNRRVPGP